MGRLSLAFVTWTLRTFANWRRRQQLARKYPDEVQVLSTRAFFWPMWHGDEIKKVHELDDYDFASSGQFGYVRDSSYLGSQGADE
jgi:hypothetical protein